MTVGKERQIKPKASRKEMKIKAAINENEI